MNILRIVTISTFMVFQTLSCVAQQRISLEVNGGIMSGLYYQSDILDVDLDFGVSTGINYMYFIKPKWGVETGLQLGLSKSQIKFVDNALLTSLEVDDANSGFELQVLPKGYQEKVTFNYLAVPLRFVYDPAYSTGQKTGIYFSIGSQYILPLKTKSNIKADEIKMQGYYPNFDLLIDQLPQHGFGTIQHVSDTIDLSFNSTVTLNVAIGLSYKMRSVSIYLGGYADYGIMNLNRSLKETSTIVKYNPNALPNEISAGTNSLKEIKAVNLLSFGLQLKMSLTSINSNRSKNSNHCMY